MSLMARPAQPMKPPGQPEILKLIATYCKFHSAATPLAGTGKTGPSARPTHLCRSLAAPQVEHLQSQDDIHLHESLLPATRYPGSWRQHPASHAGSRGGPCSQALQQPTLCRGPSSALARQNFHASVDRAASRSLDSKVRPRVRFLRWAYRPCCAQGPATVLATVFYGSPPTLSHGLHVVLSTPMSQ